jgi:hypothetical protein
MERRRAFAWAGSISLTACAGALLLGSLAGGFGLGPSSPPETEVIGAAPKPGGITPRPVPGGTDSGPAPGGGGEAEPAPGGGAAEPAPGGAEAGQAPGSGPAVPRDASSPAGGGGKFPASVAFSLSSARTSLSGPSIPSRAPGKPATPGGGGTRAPASAPAPNPDRPPARNVAIGNPSQPTGRSLRQLATAAPVARRSGTSGGGDHRSEGSGQRSGAGKAHLSVRRSAQLGASMLGRSSGGGDTKKAAGGHVGHGRGGNG